LIRSLLAYWRKLLMRIILIKVSAVERGGA
jgi:hypothetical protein